MELPASALPKNMRCLVRSFRAEPDYEKNRIRFWCRQCSQGWSVPREDRGHTGNVLHLLNHEASHD